MSSPDNQENFPMAIREELRALSDLPYENLSKIVAFHQSGGLEKSLDLSVGWLESARESGVGGTCFSLTWFLAGRIRALGMECAFLMADKGHARDIHCGLRFDWEGRSYLLDPGYMIFDPLPLPLAGLSCACWVSPNEVRLEHIPDPGVWRLWSGLRGQSKHRFDFRQKPVNEAEFQAYWENSYAFPMMAYPVLNRVHGGVQYYLQKRNLLVRTPEGGGMRKLSEAEFRATLGETFGIPEALAREAMEIVVRGNKNFFQA